MVDSFKFLPRSFREGFAAAPETPGPIPWVPLARPVREARFALVTTAGIWATCLDPPFDYEGEKREPPWGDPSFRIIRRDTPEEEGRPIMVLAHERIYTVETVAAYLGVSPWTVKNWLWQGRLRGYRLGGPRLGWRVKEADLARFIETKANVAAGEEV